MEILLPLCRNHMNNKNIWEPNLQCIKLILAIYITSIKKIYISEKSIDYK